MPGPYETTQQALEGKVSAISQPHRLIRLNYFPRASDWSGLLKPAFQKIQSPCHYTSANRTEPQNGLERCHGAGSNIDSMIAITTVVVLLVAIVIWYLRSRPKILRNGTKLKTGPDTLPVLGNAIKFLQPRHVLFDWFVGCQRRFGRETFEISVPTLPPGVVVNDPLILEFIFKNEAIITKGSFFKERSWDLFGFGIINASGELWKAQRKAGLKFFAGTNLDAMVEEVLPEVFMQTCQTIDKASKEGNEVDMAKVFLDFTTSVVGQMAYDMEIDSSSPFSRSFDYASDQVGLRFQNPLYWITELLTGRQFRECLVEVKKFGRKIVSNAKVRRSHIAFESLVDNEEPVFGSLIDSLIETLRDPKLVADSALNFLSAGRDTTAQSMTWMLYALLRHPDALTKLTAEVDTLFASLESLHTPSPDAIDGVNHVSLTTSDLQPSSLPYTTAVFYESLRLFPPVPFELKQCESDVTLPDGTFLPASSIVVWCIWAMNRSTTTFGADADDFRPERWLIEDTSTVSERTPRYKLITKSAWEFPVFNGGPRACLGKKMAEMMACWIFARLVRDWVFEEVVEYEEGTGEEVVGIEERQQQQQQQKKKKDRISQNSLTLPMKGGLPCRVRRRERQVEKKE